MDTKENLLGARFYVNMQRIGGLTRLVCSGTGPLTPAAIAIESESVRADLFRAIVVFLHAAFEDILRTAARQRLCTATSEVLKDIPLIGTSKFGRADKFHLGTLNAHRGKTVDQLIQESVDGYLDRESFGSCADVDEVLSQMGLDTTPFKSLYVDLDQMMKRRHRIVHEADLPSPQDRIPSPWTIWDHFQLCLWNLAVLAFYALLCVSVDPADELQRWYFVRRTRAIELARQTREEMIALRDQPAESIMFGFQNAIEKLAQVSAFLGPPSQEELRAICERLEAK
jgi:hypothetical protein